MSRQLQLVRLVGACLILLAAVVFCIEFSGYQVAALAGVGIGGLRLPAICRFFAGTSHWILLAPPLLLAIGLQRLLRERTESVGAEIVQQLAVVLAVILILGCIVAWQIPYAASAVGTF